MSPAWGSASGRGHPSLCQKRKKYKIALWQYLTIFLILILMVVPQLVSQTLMVRLLTILHHLQAIGWIDNTAVCFLSITADTTDIVCVCRHSGSEKINVQTPVAVA
jgi:hypothetical protein